MTPKITVLTITCRNQYMKEQSRSLMGQTFQDLEWVVVDDNYKLNKELLKETVGGAFPFTHIPPREIRDYVAISEAYNSGLVYSRGELVFFMCDYVIPRSDCLERHWEIYQEYKNVIISGRSVKVGFPPSVLERGVGSWSGWDYRRGLFEGGFFHCKKIDDDLDEAFPDGAKNWYAGRNDSAPLEVLLECNGFEEEIDGSWGYHDHEMAQRLMTYGLRYILDKKSNCMEFEHVSGGKKRIRTDEEQIKFQYSLIDRKMIDGVYKSNLKRDLRKERERCLIQ